MVLCAFDEKSIRIKFVDKNTNSPLFGQGASYTIDKLKITRESAASFSPTVKLDANDPTVVIVGPLFGGEVLTLGNLPADRIMMEARSKGKECCAGIDVISLKISGETICAPCTDLNGTIAVIKK
jgi:hypothetical protein